MLIKEQHIIMPAILEDRYKSLREALQKIEVEESNPLEACKRAIHTCTSSMGQLKEYISTNPFDEPTTEIRFFKLIKPSFYSLLIYYLKLYRIEAARPFSGKDQKSYLKRSLQRIQYVFEDNKAFCEYIRSDAGYMDERYFLRRRDGTLPSEFGFSFEANPDFSTPMDYTLSKLIACEMLTDHLQESLQDLLRGSEKAERSSIAVGPLHWTAPKVALIELIYALQAFGAFNHGEADIKTIADTLERVFNINLGNLYRTFQEIRLRKKARAEFLETLIKSLIKRMDNTDENPR